MNAVRAPALVVLLALLVGAFAFGAEPAAPTRATERASAPAEWSPAGGAADLWFCEGPTPRSPGVADRVVTLANPGAEPAEGRITVVDELGNRVSRTYQVEAAGRFEFRPDPFVPEAEFAAVTVEAPSGGLYVDQRVEGEASVGLDRGPCVTVTSAAWRHPWGTTERPGTTAVLLLHNPFPGNAVADLRLVGDLGRRESLDSQGIVVGSRSLVALDLGERIADSEVVSAIVDVRVGQLVSTLFLTGDGFSPNAWDGVDVTPGLPGDADRLFLSGPGLSDPDAGAEQAASPLDASVVLLNAGAEAVEVEVVPHPSSGGVFVEPFRVLLHAGRRQVVDLLGDGRLDGVGPFLLEVRSLDAPTIAAALVTREYRSPGDDSRESARPGFDVQSAVGHAATSWRVRVDGQAAGTATMVVVNPSSAGIATVELARVAAPDAGDDPAGGASDERPLPSGLELDPGTLVEVPLSPGVVAVEASAPVVVLVREVGPTGRTGWSGVAGAGTVVRPS